MKPARSQVFAWSMYDFASSAFNTLVLTFIFSFFFMKVVVADEVAGGVLWARAVNITALLVAIATPVLGAIADYSGRKKLFLMLAAGQSIIFTSLLYFVGPGEAVLAMTIFIIANIGFEASQVFYNALLPDVSTPRTIGRVSGIGYALGYMGGLLALVVGLGMVGLGDSPGWLPDAGYLDVRATNLLVAGWFAIFALPTFLLLKEKGEPRKAPLSAYAREGFHRLAVTIRHARDLKEAGKLLIARMIYNDGLATIIAMASIYAAAVLGMELDEVLVMAIFLNVAAGIGAFSFGFINDRIGGKRTIAITLVVLTIAAIIGATTETKTGFWVAAILVGLMMGPNQSASRALLANLVPDQKHTEFFGLYAFSGKFSSILGPLLYGVVLSISESHRLAMGSMGFFFSLGLVVLLFVREAEGLEIAERLSERPLEDEPAAPATLV